MRHASYETARPVIFVAVMASLLCMGGVRSGRDSPWSTDAAFSAGIGGTVLGLTMGLWMGGRRPPRVRHGIFLGGILGAAAGCLIATATANELPAADWVALALVIVAVAFVLRVASGRRRPRPVEPCGPSDTLYSGPTRAS